MNLSEEQILNALSHVIEPELKQDIVTAGLVNVTGIEGNEVRIEVKVHSPAMHSKKAMEEACIFNIKRFMGNDADVKVTIIPLRKSAPRQNEAEPLPGIDRIIAVASGKGGVGKSTVAVNIAAGLAKKGFRTGIVDADIYGPSVPLMMDVFNARPEVMEVSGMPLMGPVEKYGVKIMSIGFFAEANQAIPWRGPMAVKALKQMFTDVAWGELDYLIIDLPPGTGDIHLSLVQSVPLAGAIIVSTPQLVALADARKAVNMFRLAAINVTVLGMVENMSWFSPPELPGKKYYLFGKEGARKLAEELELPLLGEIPLTEEIREGGDKGKPAVLYENSVQENAFMRLVEKIIVAVPAK
ncbi:MAG: Mrp/NBP35 family ATP-binding protein [Bacteroidetes bacterium]|nr:Mrp/NBP35 family ATP-binding protein [Bacteroidota bacterium]